MLKRLSRKTNFVLIWIVIGLFIGVSINQAFGGSDPTIVDQRNGNLAVNIANVYQNGLLVPYGNVGIGVANPTVKLDVNGYVKSTTAFCIGDTCIDENQLKVMLGIGGSGSNLIITTTSVPDATVGIPYTFTFSSTGGTVSIWNLNPYNTRADIGGLEWSNADSSGRPNGLGVIRGTPTTAGTYRFTVMVNGSVSKEFTLVVNPSSGAPTYNLLVTHTGTGTGIVLSAPIGKGVGLAGTSFTSGTSVTLTATSNAGSTFAGWSGDCSGTVLTCTVVMSSDKNVTATFTPANQNNYTQLYIYRVGNGKITVDPANKSCDFTAGCAMMAVPALTGTSVTLNAIPAAGYVFSGWSSSVSGTCSGVSAQCTFILNENNNVTATFTSGNGKVNPNSPITITSPNGGVYKPGDKVHIQWTGATKPIRLLYIAREDAGGGYASLSDQSPIVQPSIPVTQNSYDLTIPNVSGIQESSQYRVIMWVDDNSDWQYSSHFTIQASY